MKKIFNLFVVSAVALLFSSCIVDFGEWDFDDGYWTTGTSSSYSSSTYDFTFYNNTSKTVTDWFIQDKKGNNTALSTSNLCPCYSNSSSTMMDVQGKTYTVYFSYTSSPEEDDYYVSDSWFLLDKNVTYYLKSDSYKSRGLGENSSEESYYIEDSNGNVYPLKKANGVNRF